MDIKNKLDVLEQVYQIYDSFASNMDMACKKYCSDCCTKNVTMTSLEGYGIIDNIMSNGEEYVLKKFDAASYSKRFVPKITTNRLAFICAKGDEPPVEDIDPLWGTCPFLQDDICRIYEARPFGCRCFTSKHKCSEKGYAEIDSLVVEVNTLFLQYIEHIDSKGYFGNLTDIVRYIIVNKNNETGDEAKKKELKKKILENHPITVFLISHEHKKKIKHVLDALNSIKVPASCKK